MSRISLTELESDLKIHPSPAPGGDPGNCLGDPGWGLYQGALIGARVVAGGIVPPSHPCEARKISEDKSHIQLGLLVFGINLAHFRKLVNCFCPISKRKRNRDTPRK